MKSHLLTTLQILLLLGYGKAFGQEYDGLLMHSEPVDISRYLEVCDWLSLHSEDDNYYNEQDSLIDLDLPTDDDYSVLYSGKSYAVSVPKYYRSKNPFIRYAQNLYNGFVYARNMYCNYEVWIRINSTYLSDLSYWVDDKDIISATKKIRASVIRDRKLRRVARKSKEAIVEHLKKGYDEETEFEGIDALMSFCDLVYDRSLKLQDMIDTANHIVDSIWGVNVGIAQERLQRYLDAEEDNRLRIMLEEMAACRDFDEQCVLWINWVMNRDFDDYMFILATGCVLMDSGNYSPVLDEVWDTWRSFFQPLFHGASVDALIPNAYYNKYRKKCFITCLKHIDKHPDDVYAMMCAANLAVNSNIERYGGFGNTAMSKILLLTPNHTDE